MRVNLDICDGTKDWKIEGDVTLSLCEWEILAGVVIHCARSTPVGSCTLNPAETVHLAGQLISEMEDRGAFRLQAGL